MEIERLVQQMNALAAERNRGYHGKEARKMLKQEQGLEQQAFKKADEMAMWLKLGGQPDHGFDVQALQAMRKGQPPPWQKQVHEGLGALHYHGQRLCMANADLARCTEELALLPVEKQRARVWVSFMMASAEMAMEGLPPSPVLSKPAMSLMDAITEHATASSSCGQRFLIEQKLSVLSGMSKQIAKW